jgi:hypothetical protein
MESSLPPRDSLSRMLTKNHPDTNAKRAGDSSIDFSRLSQAREWFREEP